MLGGPHRFSETDHQDASIGPPECRAGTTIRQTDFGIPASLGSVSGALLIYYETRLAATILATTTWPEDAEPAMFGTIILSIRAQLQA